MAILRALKLALHRSITFWSGLLVIASVCWGWFYSFRGGPYLLGWKAGAGSIAGGILVHWHPDGGSWPFAIGSTAAGLAHLRDAPKLPAPFVIRGGITYAEAGLASPMNDFPTLKMYFQARAPFYEPSYRVWFVPHWCLLLAAGSLWAALLLWRARRRNRLGPVTVI